MDAANPRGFAGASWPAQGKRIIIQEEEDETGSFGYGGFFCRRRDCERADTAANLGGNKAAGAAGAYAEQDERVAVRVYTGGSERAQCEQQRRRGVPRAADGD